MSNLRVAESNVLNGALVWICTLDFWQYSQVFTNSVQFLLTLIHVNLWVTSFLVALIPGCDVLCSKSKMMRWYFAGTIGLSELLVLSQIMLLFILIFSLCNFIYYCTDVSSFCCLSKSSYWNISFGNSIWLIFSISMRDNASAASLSHPDMCLISQVNSEMNDKCLDCLGDFSVSAFYDVVRSLWSVWMWNDLPSRKYLKCRIASYIANNSRSNVLYRVCAGVNFLEKNANG